VLVDFDERATLFDLAGLRREHSAERLGLFLEEQLGCAVDVVPRRALREEIREEVLLEAMEV